jgi:hypothetical protein
MYMAQTGAVMSLTTLLRFLELLGSDAGVWESTREDSAPAVEDCWMRPSVQRFQPRIPALGSRVLLQSDSRVLRFRHCQFNDHVTQLRRSESQMSATPPIRTEACGYA